MPDIVTVTANPTIDTSCWVQRVVAEHKLECEQLRSDPGGGGINVARVVAALGGDVRAVCTCGGPRGQLLQRRLEAVGLAHQTIAIQDDTRENVTVGEQTTGQQYRFVMPGPTLDASEGDALVDTLGALDPPPHCVVLSGSLPPGADETLYGRMAKTLHGTARVVVDTRGAPLRHALEQGVYAIKPNLRELSELTGETLEDDAAIERAAQRLISQGSTRVVFVSLGAGGAIVAEGERCFRIRTPTVPVRSKVGAGDSAVGGLVLQLARGTPIVDAARYAVAAGAAAVMTSGTALCRRDDVERLYARMTDPAGP